MIDILNKSYISIPVEYKSLALILYSAKYKNVYYININSLCGKNTTVERWKRRTSTNELIKNLSIKTQVSKPFLSSKNKGTWVSPTLFEDFGNWLGEKQWNIKNFGTYVKTHINKLYSKYATSGPRTRFNSDHFINLTDISTIYEKDIRAWKKTKARKEYTLENKDHCLSGNNITNELGIRTTYGYPTLALQLLEYYNKKNKEEDDIQYSLRIIIEKHEEYFNEDEVTDEIIEHKNPIKKLNLMNLTKEDFKGCRITPDGMFSVYDAIAKFKNITDANARREYSRIEVASNLVLLQKFKFKGRGQRETPVATFHELLQILSQLPGQQTKMLRKEQTEISTRAIAGDEDLEEAVRDQREKVSEGDRKCWKVIGKSV